MLAASAGGAADVPSAPDIPDWEKTLTPAAPREGDGNALRRWQAVLAELGPVDGREFALLMDPPDETPDDEQRSRIADLCARHAGALAAFRLEPGEFVQYSRLEAAEFPFPSPSLLQQLCALKKLQVRRLWWEERRDAAVNAAVDLLQAGGAAVRESRGIHAWVTWLDVQAAGCDAAWWIARQFDAAEADLRRLSAALEAAGAGWPEGVANALRGEYIDGFRPLIERLPRSNDVAAMLDAIAVYGAGTGASPAATSLGRAPVDLLDVPATLEAYGRPLAEFIDELRADPVWRYYRFTRAFEHRTDAWMRELGAFGEFVMEPPPGPLTPQRRAAIRDALAHARNPVGKLLIPHFTPSIDGMVYAGAQAEAQRRGIRVLVEWRRQILQGQPLATSAADWSADGLPERETEDPFTGRSLLFDPAQLRVWSVGIDGVDNHGRGDPRQDADGADFSWSLSGKPADEEENAAPASDLLRGLP